MEPEDLSTVLECAQLAPSVHNTQPWTCVVVGNRIEISTDHSRGLPVLDPTGRQLAFSGGAAIEFAATAVRGLGWACSVELLPREGDENLLAVITIGTQRDVTGEDRALLEAIPRRYTDRGGYEEMTLSHELVDKLSAGVGTYGAWLRVLDREGDRLAVILALSRAEEVESNDPAFREELAGWLRDGPAVDGLPRRALVDRAPINVVTDVQRRDFTGADEHLRPGGDGPPPTVIRDTLLLIGTSNDTILDWINAGRATAWMMLTLTVAGWSSQPLGQALDLDSSRQGLARTLGLLGHIQFLLRAGEGHGTATTGRRHSSLGGSRETR